MYKETIIQKLTQPLVCIVAIAVAVGTGVAYGCINHVRNEKQEFVSKADISVYREATSDELIILRAEDMTQAATAPLEAESQDNLLQTVRDYFTARYNFKGSYSENEDAIIKAVKPLAADFEDSKKQNGTDREMKDYRCEVLKIYRNGYSETEMKSKGIQPSYFCLVRINCRNTLYRIKMEYADGNYLIGSQEMLGTEQEAKD